MPSWMRVAAANILTAPLQAGHVSVSDLAKVQRRREWPTRIIQALVNVLQDRLFKAALDPNGSIVLPRILGWPLMRKLPAHLLGFGILPEHIETEARHAHTRARIGKWGAAFAVTLVVGWIIRRFVRRFADSGSS